MSGSALASWALVNDANDVALQVAQAADCVHLVGDRSDSETILNCLRDAPLERIEQAAAKVGRPGSFRRFRTIFGPSIDGVVIRGQHLSSGSSSSGSGGPRKRSEDGRPTYNCLFSLLILFLHTYAYRNTLLNTMNRKVDRSYNFKVKSAFIALH